MSTVLIVGASQGIGFEFATQYAKEQWQVLATCRDDAAKGLLEAIGPNVKAYTLDVRDIGAISTLAAHIGAAPIDVVIANAGIYGGGVTLSQASAEAWIDVLKVNTIAPVMLGIAFSGNLAASKEKKLVAITSLMGSIEDNTSGGHIPYRTSKAALNMAWKSLSLDYENKGIIASLIHPGWVRTRMGGQSAPLSAADSAAGMRKVIANLTKKDSGTFLNYAGKALPW